MPRRPATKPVKSQYITLACAICQRQLRRSQRLYLQRGFWFSFCGRDCYAQALHRPGFFVWERGRQALTAQVMKFVPLKPWQIVVSWTGSYHKASWRDALVLANCLEAAKFRRGVAVRPVWKFLPP